MAIALLVLLHSKVSLTHYILKHLLNLSPSLIFRTVLIEGNGTPFQYSRLENPMDGGAWWAAVHGVVKSWTRLSDFPFTFMHWRRKWQPTPVFLPGESQGQGSLVGCRLWGRTESDTTERLSSSNMVFYDFQALTATELGL